jgi:malate dehydrogenase (oxaloacetate-decarboxylating)
MGIPSASYSITMRVHLGADPLCIGRITTAVGEAAGTVVAVDIVESHPDLLVVDLTCNARDTDHAEAITRAVGEVEGARVHTVSDRNLSLLHSIAPRLTRQSWPSEQPPASGGRKVEGNPGRRPTRVRHR